MYGSDFVLKTIAEMYLVEDKMLFAALMDLKAYGRIDRKALWDVLRAFGVGGYLLAGIIYFYKDGSASLWIGIGESFGVDVVTRQGCVMLHCLFYIYMGEMKTAVKDFDVRWLWEVWSSLVVTGVLADGMLAKMKG